MNKFPKTAHDCGRYNSQVLYKLEKRRFIYPGEVLNSKEAWKNLGVEVDERDYAAQLYLCREDSVKLVPMYRNPMTRKTWERHVQEGKIRRRQVVDDLADTSTENIHQLQAE